jgi:hypothetical protein
VQIPIRTVSETNVREHWRARHSRRKRQRATALYCAQSFLGKPSLPCEITLIRIAPRKLDGHDNLRSSLKATADAIADWLGTKDNDPRVAWLYDQRKGEPRTYGVRVNVRATAVLAP